MLTLSSLSSSQSRSSARSLTASGEPSSVARRIVATPALREACGAEFRARALAGARNGSEIPVFTWGWGDRGVDSCPDDRLQQLQETYRRRPDTQDMLGFVPCDLWEYMAGRTLWIVGDRCGGKGGKRREMRFVLGCARAERQRQCEQL